MPGTMFMPPNMFGFPGIMPAAAAAAAAMYPGHFFGGMRFPQQSQQQQQSPQHQTGPNANLANNMGMIPPNMWAAAAAAASHPLLMQQALALNMAATGAAQHQPAVLASSLSSQQQQQQSQAGHPQQNLVSTSRASGMEAVERNVTGRPPALLFMACDNDSLSEYQCLVRKQIELFEALSEDVETNAQGRNRPIVMGQVGIRCRHCSMLPPKHRARGAVYYPARLNGLYQAAQNMATSHLSEHCQHIREDVRNELKKLRDRKSSAGGGKKYWADGVRVLGVFEDQDGLRFETR